MRMSSCTQRCRLPPSVQSNACSTSRLSPSAHSNACSTSRLSPSVHSNASSTSGLTMWVMMSCDATREYEMPNVLDAILRDVCRVECWQWGTCAAAHLLGRAVGITDHWSASWGARAFHVASCLPPTHSMTACIRRIEACPKDAIACPRGTMACTAIYRKGARLERQIVCSGSGVTYMTHCKRSTRLCGMHRRFRQAGCLDHVLLGAGQGMTSHMR